MPPESEYKTTLVYNAIRVYSYAPQHESQKRSANPCQPSESSASPEKCLFTDPGQMVADTILVSVIYHGCWPAEGTYKYVASSRSGSSISKVPTSHPVQYHFVCLGLKEH